MGTNRGTKRRTDIMNLNEWEQSIKICTDSELSQLLTSIENLKNWETFDKAFKWTGYGVIGTMIENEIRRRKRTSNRRI